MYGEDVDEDQSWFARWRARRTAATQATAMEAGMAAIEQRSRPALVAAMRQYGEGFSDASFGATGWTPFQVVCQKGWREGVLALGPHADRTRSPTDNPAESPLFLAAPHGAAFLLSVIEGDATKAWSSGNALATSNALTSAVAAEAQLALLLPSDADREVWGVWCQTHRSIAVPSRPFRGGGGVTKI